MGQIGQDARKSDPRRATAGAEPLKALVAAPCPAGASGRCPCFTAIMGNPSRKVTTDVMGNVGAVINPDASLRFIYAGHRNEMGQRVRVHGHEGVRGTTGCKAIKTFQASDRKQTPSLKELWTDIGASSRRGPKRSSGSAAP